VEEMEEIFWEVTRWRGVGAGLRKGNGKRKPRKNPGQKFLKENMKSCNLLHQREYKVSSNTDGLERIEIK